MTKNELLPDEVLALLLGNNPPILPGQVWEAIRGDSYFEFATLEGAVKVSLDLEKGTQVVILKDFPTNVVMPNFINYNREHPNDLVCLLVPHQAYTWDGRPRFCDAFRFVGR